MKLYHVLLAGLVAGGLVMAQENAATGTAPATTEKAAPVKAKKAPAVKTMMTSGAVVSVDAIANTLIVEVKKGKKTVEDTLYTNDKTALPKGKTLADLKTGDKVTVWCKMEEGKMMATKIVEKVAPKAKPVKKEAAPAAPAAGEAK